jgi:ABC-type lipoprotein export system ATPase subunit
MDELLVSLDGVSRHYGRGRTETAALCNVSCQITANARVAIVGPSGSGKSTLLHLIAGLDTPTTGVIRWPGLGSEADLLGVSNTEFAADSHRARKRRTLLVTIEEE